MNRLRQKYQEELVAHFLKNEGYDNTMAVPRLKKIVVNVGISEPQGQKQALENMRSQLAVITGQQPAITRAKQSIAGFKLRQGDPIGLMVTLRGERMYQFMDKLVSVVLPKVKDFQGVSNSAFDADGNYNLGIHEQIIFPEIEYDKIDKVRGFQITFVTSAHSATEAKKLLEQLGMPFAKEETEA